MKKFCKVVFAVLCCLLTGAIFVGCVNDNPDDKPNDDVTPEKQYTVAFYDGERLVDSQLVAQGKQFAFPADGDVVSKAYLTVDGWSYKDGDGTVIAAENIDKTVNGDISLVAHTVVKPHTAVVAEGFRTSFAFGENYVCGSNAKVKFVYADGTSDYIDSSDYTVKAPDDFGKQCKSYDVTVSVTVSGEQTTVTTNVTADKSTFKVLVIGNSYSDDTIAYAYKIAESAGFADVAVADMYVGSCALAQHVDFAKNDKAMYLYRYFDKDNRYTDVDASSGTLRTLEWGIVQKDWDYIVLQQNSLYSGKADQYDMLQELIDYVKSKATKRDVRIAFNMTWAYAANSSNGSFVNYDNDQTKMYNDICNAVKTCVLTNKDISFVVSCGTAIQNARTSFAGDNLTRDGFDHLNKTYGRYIAGLTLVTSLTGVDIQGISYAPAGVDEKYASMAKESATNAFVCPFAVTQSTIK